MGPSVSIYADTEGKSYCWVDTVKSISRENCIQVTVDVEGIQLPASQVAIFRYTSLPENIVLIPAGEFQMGNDGYDDTNGHTVYVDEFYMDRLCLHCVSY